MKTTMSLQEISCKKRDTATAYNQAITDIWADGEKDLKEIWTEIKPHVDDVGDEMPIAILSDCTAFLYLTEKYDIV